ncbi:MAG: universal stress protein [Bacteroidota bacterium]|nr:universal stress protein [Bacteroidota bacterium]
MKKILVPTDFTDIAENGLKVAIELTRKANAEIILLNVIYPVKGTTFTAMGDINNMPRGQADRFMAELVRTNKARLDKLIGKYNEQGVEITPQIDFEDKTHGLSHYAREHEIDLIVIGTKGSKSLNEYLFGSHTENIIKASDCPVISVKKPVENFSPENIVFAVDINKEEYHGIENLKNFASEFNSEVHFLYVMDDGIDNNEAVSKLQNLAEKNKFDRYSINTVNNGNVEDTIKKFAKRKEADMLAVISEGKKGSKNSFLEA